MSIVVPNVADPVEVFQKFTESRLFDVHTMIPGQIVSYDKASRIASVQALVNLRRVVNGKELDIPIPQIDNVPVIYLTTSACVIEIPISPGDGCAILFSEVGIGNYLNGAGAPVQADDASRHSLTDAMCIPGLFNRGNLPKSPPTIQVTETGAINFGAGTSAFVKGDVLERILNTLFTGLLSIPVTDPVTAVSSDKAIKAAVAIAQNDLSLLNSTRIKGE